MKKKKTDKGKTQVQADHVWIRNKKSQNKSEIQSEGVEPLESGDSSPLIHYESEPGIHTRYDAFGGYCDPPRIIEIPSPFRNSKSDNEQIKNQNNLQDYFTIKNYPLNPKHLSKLKWDSIKEGNTECILWSRLIAQSLAIINGFKPDLNYRWTDSETDYEFLKSAFQCLVVDKEFFTWDQLRELSYDQLKSELQQAIAKEGNCGEVEADLQYLSIFKESITQLIEKGEGHFIEFKASLEYDIKKNERNKELNKECLKTMAAFLNTDGGVLLIGVKDDGSIFGIEEDLKNCHNNNTDGFELKLRDLILNYLTPLPHKKISFIFEKINQKSVCRVNVKPINHDLIVYFENNNIYIRDGNKKINLKGTIEIANWIQQRNKAN